jgi:hypothetical protein
MTLKELEARLKNLEDVEAINRLQRAYGYYLVHWEGKQLAALFSDAPDVTLGAGDGGVVFSGQKDVKNFFKRIGDPPELLHGLMQLSGIVDVDLDGKTAKGRWFGFGPLAIPGEDEKVKAIWGFGIYENEYVKEKGRWKIKKLHYDYIMTTPYEDGWVKTPTMRIWGDLNSYDKPYPSGFILPYHYKNPGSGK